MAVKCWRDVQALKLHKSNVGFGECCGKHIPSTFPAMTMVVIINYFSLIV